MITKKIKGLVCAVLCLLGTVVSAGADEWNGTVSGKLFYLDGKVGIGTDTPDVKLEVAGTTNTEGLRLGGDGWKTFHIDSNDSGTEISFRSSGAASHDGSIIYNQNKNFSFMTDRGSSNTVDMTLTAAGELGIGTSIPESKLHVSGSGGFGSLIKSTNTSSGKTWHFGTTVANFFTIAQTGVSDWFSIQQDTGRVGIGTTTPGATLEVNGNVGIGASLPGFALNVKAQTGVTYAGLDANAGSNARLVFSEAGAQKWNIGNNAYNGSFNLWHNDSQQSMIHVLANGNIGMGTSDPWAKLHIKGDGFPGSFIYMDTNADNQDAGLRLYENGQVQFHIYHHAMNDVFRIVSHQDTAGGINLTADGNVGIGTEHPGVYRLAVNGTIKAKELLIDSSGWADFVFEDDYELAPLSEVESFIEENGHLPEIPSAEEVEKNGISQSEMNAKLLQKVEELTLYMIEMQKENQGLKAKVSELENKLQ